MLKHIDIMVVNKDSGEIRHEIRRTCNLDVKEDFDLWFERVSAGFIRLMKQSSDNVITISCEDYKRPQEQFLF